MRSTQIVVLAALESCVAMSRAGERERIVAGTERGDLLIVEAGELRLALSFENAPAIDAILATPKAPPNL